MERRELTKVVVFSLVALSLEGLLVYFSNLSFIFNNFLKYCCIFLILFSLSALFLLQIPKKFKYLHLFFALLFFIVFYVVLNKTSFISLYLTFLHLFLFLIYLEGSLEKFKAKLSLSSYLALFSATFCFIFLMNTFYYSNFIKNLANTKLVDESLDKTMKFSASLLTHQLEKHIKNIGKESFFTDFNSQINKMLEQIDKQIKMINESTFLNESEKKKKIEELKEQKKKLLETSNLSAAINSSQMNKILNEEIKEEVKKQFRSLLDLLSQNSLVVKLFIIPFYFFFYQFLMTVGTFISTLLLLICRTVWKLKKN